MLYCFNEHIQFDSRSGHGSVAEQGSLPHHASVHRAVTQVSALCVFASLLTIIFYEKYSQKQSNINLLSSLYSGVEKYYKNKLRNIPPPPRK